MNAFQLLDGQEKIAADVLSSITASDDSVAYIPTVGLGKTPILLTALSRAAQKNKTILIACAPALLSQWNRIISEMMPTAPVFFHGVSEVGDTKYRSFTPLQPKSGPSYTFEYLANVPSSQWKMNRSQPSFFLVTFPNIKHVSEQFNQWFDFAVEDEYWAYELTDKLHDELRRAAKNVVRVQVGSRPAGVR